ncbi:MAG TPA: class I SAM-dependent methyltransferase [Anaeromyxobacteraceae bacterium]|nr:class I SAM-dependent methyltransferase [Anaeromyxobacteraceae bacterium]
MATEKELSLGSIQKTLLLPLWGRAVETGGPQPLLVDRPAAELVGRLHYDFATISESIPAVVRLGWIARALHVDRAVKACLAERSQATVVNLGCGLDTTFQRVDNGSMRWIDLDLPDVIALRSDLLPSRPRQRSLAVSILDPGWIGEVDASDGVFVVAAGVLCYFEEQQVRDLLVRLARAFPGGGMVLDTFSPLGMGVSNRRILRDSGMDAGAVLRWCIKRPRDIQHWDDAIRVASCSGLYSSLSGRLPFVQRVGPWAADAVGLMSMTELRFAPVSGSRRSR